MNDLRERLVLHNHYTVECFDRNGNRKWVEEIDNLVTNEGLNDVLSKYLKGSAYTAAWYVGLIDNANFTAIAAGDTAAKINTTANPPTTNGWQEAEDYAEAVRQTLTLGAVSGQSVDNSASKAAFSINGTVVVKGAFVASVSTKGGTTGVLLGVAAFAANRSAENGDTLNCQITSTVASA